MKKTLILALCFIAVLLIAGFCVLRFYVLSEWNGQQQRIYLPLDGDVRSELTSQLGPSFGSKVYTMLGWQGKKDRKAHGSFVVDNGDEAFYVARSIAQGHQDPVKLTFNNIRTFGDLASRISRQLEFDSTAFVMACDTMLTGKGFRKEEFTAAFIPDTYEFYWTASPGTVIEKLAKERSDFWNDSRLEKAGKLGLTPTEVHTLASIVASESNKADEWGKIARLYLNRLGKGMPLQADPTVVFAVGDFSLRRVLAKHLKTESPYNTYINKGLPPGPIRMVERAQLNAVLDAPENDFLYMCAKPDFSGYHNFAKDYNRHRINAARYYRALKQRGI